MKAEPILMLPLLMRLILPVFSTVPKTKSTDEAIAVLLPRNDIAPVKVFLGFGREIFPMTKPSLNSSSRFLMVFCW